MEMATDYVKAQEAKKTPTTIWTKSLAGWVMENDAFFSAMIEAQPELGKNDKLLLPAMMLNRLCQRFTLPEDYELSAWRYAPEDGE